MNKTVLSASSSEPLTIEQSEEYVLIKQHPNKLKLSKETAQWVYEALKQADPASGSDYENSIGVLEVLKNTEGVHISAVSSSFRLTGDAYGEIIRWLEDRNFAS